jgi:hypothetical protein
MSSISARDGAQRRFYVESRWTSEGVVPVAWSTVVD